MREKIIEIIGSGMERERAECKADQIIKLTAEYMHGISTALQYGDIQKAMDIVALFDEDRAREQYYCSKCFAWTKEECICDET